jgi:[ribosomal protein S5]-alanine N-acetyltransferase
MYVKTQRYIVRDFISSDWCDFSKYQNDARYRRLYDFTEDNDRVSKLFSLFGTWKNDTPRENFQGGIFDQRTNGLCGCAGIRKKGLPAKTAILGIELTPDDWGRYKLALEVAVGLINYGFEELGLDMIIGDTSSGNTRIEKMARWFGAEIINERDGPEWMQNRGWKEVDWAISKESWQLGKARRLLSA